MSRTYSHFQARCMVAVNSCLRPLTDVFGFGPSFVLCHVWRDVEKGQNTLRVRKTMFQGRESALSLWPGRPRSYIRGGGI